MRAAVNLLGRAVELLQEGSRPRLELLPDLGEAMMEIGEFVDAQQRLDEAVAGAGRLGDTPLEADAILTRLLVTHHSIEDLDAWCAEVQTTTDRLIPQLGQPSAAGVLAKAWRMVGYTYGSTCQWRETALAYEKAIRSARIAGDARQLARLSSGYVLALSEGPVPAFEAIERTEEILRDGLVDRQAEALVLQALAPLYAMTGELERARELAARSIELLRDLGATVLLAQTSCSSSRVEFIAGDVQAAETALRADYEALTALDERYFRPLVAALLAKALFALDRRDEAREFVEVAEALASPDDIEAQALVRSVRSRLHAMDGRLEQGQALAREAVALVKQTDSPILQADTLVDVSGVLASLPEERILYLEEARALYTEKQHLQGIAQVEAELSEAASVG
jgi:tetratricopeptide (TPR) repeat protein